MDNRHCFSICRKNGSVAILIHRTEPTPEFGAECCVKREPNREDTIEILQAVIRHHRKTSDAWAGWPAGRQHLVTVMFFMSIQTSSQGIANQCFDKLLLSKKKLYEFVLLLPVQRAGMTTGVAQPAEVFSSSSAYSFHHRSSQACSNRIALREPIGSAFLPYLKDASFSLYRSFLLTQCTLHLQS